MRGPGLFDEEGFEADLSSVEDFDDEFAESNYSASAATNAPGTPSSAVSPESPELGRGAPGSGMRPRHAPHAPRPNRPVFIRSAPVSTSPVEIEVEREVVRSNGTKRRVKTRPMPPNLRARWPNVETMLITNRDGTQILFYALAK